MTSIIDKENSIENISTSLENPVFGNEALCNELKSYFQSISLASHQKQALEATLLSHSKTKPSVFSSFLSYHKKIIFSHVMTAAAAIAITLIFAFNFNSPSETSSHDLISEVAGLSDNLNFPADFNLDGNLNDLPDLIKDSLPNHSFSPAIPKQIAQDFSAYEGRFFLYKGEQGVGISVLPSTHELPVPLRLHQGFEHSQPSTLYIVKLSEKNKSSFPAQRMSRKVLAASGKTKRVYAWRDGTYGYAMVQPLSMIDEEYSNLKFP